MPYRELESQQPAPDIIEICIEAFLLVTAAAVESFFALAVTQCNRHYWQNTSAAQLQVKTFVFAVTVGIDITSG